MSRRRILNESDDCERANSKGSFAIAGATSFPTIRLGVRRLTCGRGALQQIQYSRALF